ncbi:hypothetical protein VFPPC_18225 [Pochonia chlamydosporia 170]|uniref:Uncharacterized protein n=1 Tax=Pochonia chlamydosporia 170 TaxID=1380566 RepID=A0A219APC4_METCM|nr:hypothetical protein VFPPC_18225 [Pochonia chlamydosporia 170]OWT42613.1 hypothetical protein VFPPC_18225 [Pochonia chlamydosporia 170]
MILALRTSLSARRVFGSLVSSIESLQATFRLILSFPCGGPAIGLKSKKYTMKLICVNSDFLGSSQRTWKTSVYHPRSIMVKMGRSTRREWKLPQGFSTQPLR